MKSISLKITVLAIVFLVVQISKAEVGCAVHHGSTIEEVKNAFNSEGNTHIISDTTWGSLSEYTYIYFSTACNFDYPVKFEETECQFHNDRLYHIEKWKQSYMDLQSAVEDAKNMENYIDSHVRLPTYMLPGAETEDYAYMTRWWMPDSPVLIQILVLRDKSLVYYYEDRRFF